MKKNMLHIPVILLLFMVMTDCHIALASNNLKTGGLAGQKAVHLFNGKNLDGWYTYIRDRGRNVDPKGVFTVQQGMIRISGEELGCITTEKEYADYHLVVEFKWGEKTYEPRVGKARDSGILLHSVGNDGASSGIWMHSIECQLIEGGTGDFIVVGDGSDQFSLTGLVAPVKEPGTYIFQPGGEQVVLHEGRVNWYDRDPNWQDVTGFRGARDVENPAGEWNKIECIVKGNEISVLLNGKLVNHAIGIHPSKGKIQIQSEGAEIFFRKVEVM
jgi:hypothetical protein